MKMIKRMNYLWALFLIWPGATVAQSEKIPTAEELITAMDENLTAETMVLTSRMVVHGRRTSRTITSRSWIEGTDKA
ncbi:MAG: hypothetical protein ACETWG_13005, partial [Candidatus Neomarinimicrobiota bacterium]